MGPARIAYHLHLNISTVHRILTRYLCPPLRFTDPATGIRVRGRARRYEYAWPGEMIHVDIKKLCESYQQLVWDWLAGWYRPSASVVVTQRNYDH